MPVWCYGGWGLDAERDVQPAPKVGKPKRDRAKNKAQRRARRHR